MRGWLAIAVVAALLSGASAAAQPACRDAARALWPDDGRLVQLLDFSPGFCAIAPWSAADAKVFAVAVAQDNGLSVGLVRAAPGNAAPTVLARGDAEALTIDPIWSPLLAIEAASPLGPGHPALGVRLSNSYTSTGRSASTEALQVFVRRGAAMVPVFAGYLRAAHSETGPCARNRRVMCRTGWTRQWTIRPAPGARGARPPDLLVRDARSGAVVSRHRWQRDGYRPPVFDRTPPLGPR